MTRPVDTIGGIPAHPLFVHIPVVLIPLATFGVLLSLWPKLRGALLLPSAVVGFIGTVGVAFTTQSGESLEERVPESAALDNHKELGEMARNFSLLFLLVLGAAVVVWYLAKRPDSAPVLAKLVTPLLAVSLVVGGVATWFLIDAGHAGAKITWDRVLKNAPAGGEGGEGGG